MKKTLMLGTAVLAIGVLGFVGYTVFADRSTPQGQAPLTEMAPPVFEQFKTAFNEARGRVRIVALLSPT
jgi:hypothetical protein